MSNRENNKTTEKINSGLINESKCQKYKTDKYGVCLDDEEYLNRASVASATDYTGIVPVAMENSDNEESYEAMFNVPVGNVSDGTSKRKNQRIQKNNKK